MTENSDSSPLGSFNYAHSFWKAANVLDKHQWEERVNFKDMPPRVLYWHAIELFLKAFLLAKGVPLKDLGSKKFGHNITNLTAEAENRGLALPDLDRRVLSSMRTAKDMINLRYLKVGVRSFARTEDIETCCETLFQLVGKELKKQGINLGPFNADLHP